MLRGEIVALLAGVVGFVAVIIVGAVLFPGIVADINAAFAPGIGLRTAALWGTGLSVAMVAVFAVIAGDGLIGEFQYMVAAFFLFFVFFTVMIAWAF